jgi:hypothetical protein
VQSPSDGVTCSNFARKMYTYLRHIHISRMYWIHNYALVCKNQQHFGCEEVYKEVKNVHHNITAAENKQLLANVKAKSLEGFWYTNIISLQFIKLSVAVIEMLTCQYSWDGLIFTATEMMTPFTVFTSEVTNHKLSRKYFLLHNLQEIWWLHKWSTSASCIPDYVSERSFFTLVLNFLMLFPRQLRILLAIPESLKLF